MPLTSDARLILFAALALFAPSPAMAAKGDTHIGFQVGGSVPTGVFSNSAKTGFEGGLAVMSMASDHVGAGLRFAYHQWGAAEVTDPVFVWLLGPGWASKANAIQTTAHVHCDVLTSGWARPYAEAGAGIYWVKGTLYDQSNSLEGERRANFGYNVGTGIRFDVSPRFDLALDGTYHRISSDPDGPSDANFLTVGVSLLSGGESPK